MKFASTLLAGLMILAAPWPIGGNYLYVRTVVLLLAAVLGGMAALSCLVERKKFRTSMVWFVLPLAAGYAIYQSLSLSGPISVYPSASRAQLYVLGSAIGLFLSSIVLFRERSTVEPLLICAGVTGFAVAFVGIVQNLGWNGKILWVYELLYGGVPFGPFVNKNNGAGFLILVLAGPLYFLAKQFMANAKQNEFEYAAGDVSLSSSHRAREKFRPVLALSRFLANLEAKHLYCLTGLIAIVAGVFLSFSRGGSVSVVAGLSTGLLLLMLANRWAVVLAAIVIASCIGTAMWVEQADAVSQSLASIAEADEDSAPRLMHWKDATSYYKAHWLLGSGLGTYRYEYPVFQQQAFRGKFAHAENVYLETLAELGMPGMAALGLTLLTLLYSIWLLFRQPRSADRALAVAGAASIVGLMAASCLDFGIYQPANFVVAAILFGCIVGRASHPECRLDRAGNDGRKSLGNYYRFGVLLILILTSAYSAFPSAAIESVQYAKRQIGLHVKYKGDSAHRLDRAEKALLFSEKFLPEDWETQYLLGQCEVFRHRQKLTEEVVNEMDIAIRQQGAEAGMSEEEIEEQFPPRSDFWMTTSLINLHRVMRITEAQNPTEFRSMRGDPTVVTPELQKAWVHFNEALSRCDRSERIHFRLAQLTVLLGPEEGNREVESKHVRDALEMAKGYTGLSYDAGLLCMHSGNFEQAAELWAGCLSRSRQYEGRIVQFGVGLPAKLYFETVLPQNPQDLLRLSKQYFSAPEQKVPNQLLLVHTRRLIKSSNLDDVQKSVLNAQAWFLAKDFEKACKEFEVVLASNADRPEWRLDYAKSLAEIGRYDDSIKEMKICQLEQPEAAIKISRLVERLKRERLRRQNSE
ncbi:O-antigen ligase family protein [Mariniblastus fucicola]|nr:O-antigen ligase family protein [Mariniblastus fucicola]